MMLVGILQALHCDKEFDYNENYGNGYDITCQGLTKQHLYLLQNITINNEIKLKIDNSTLINISSKLFHNVRGIRQLRVLNSTLTYSKGEAIFENLSKLESLEIKDTDFIITRYSYLGLSSLKNLILNNNNLAEIVPGAFDKMKNLEDLEIINNKIDDITDIPMCELKNLRFLNLSSNLISNLKKQLFICNTADRDSMPLKVNDQTVNIDRKDYITISDYNLELIHFDASYNRIDEIGDSLNYLKFITILNLQGNQLTKIESSDLSALQDLERLHLNDNGLVYIEDAVLENKENLEMLDVSHNKLFYLNLKNTPMLKYLNLGSNQFNLDIIQNISRSKSLETLLLNRNQIKSIPPNAFDKFHALLTLDLSDNHISLTKRSFEGLRMLKTLSIRNSSIEVLPSQVFKGLRKLKSLDLSRNRIKCFADNGTFDSLENLAVLNISYNNLEEFNFTLVKNLDNLRVLDVAGNRLKYIHYELIMSSLPSLSVLNIKSNLLSCEFLYKIIKFLKTKHLSYTMIEKFDYEKENVAGIYCESANIRSNTLKAADTSESSVLVDLSIVVLIVLVVIIISIVVFKIYIYLKRRRYKADEFELIGE